MVERRGPSGQDPQVPPDEGIIGREIETEVSEALDLFCRLPVDLSRRVIKRTIAAVRAAENLTPAQVSRLEQEFTAAIYDQNPEARQQLIARAKRPDDPTYEVIIKAKPRSPSLEQLVKTPDEKTVAFHWSGEGSRERFRQQRRFYTELLVVVPEREIEDYLGEICGNIDFQNKFLASRSLRERQEILLKVLHRHLVLGNSFFQIREKFFRQPFDFSPEKFPSLMSLDNYYGALLFALQAEYPQIAQNYSLGLGKTSISYGRVAVKRLREGTSPERMAEQERMQRYLQDGLAQTTPAEQIVWRALLSRQIPKVLERLRVPYDFLRRYYPQLVEHPLRIARKWAKRYPDHLPGGRLARYFKLLVFARNKSPELSAGPPIETFWELVEKSDQPLPPHSSAGIEGNRVWALRTLKKLDPERTLRELPEMSIDQIIEEIVRLFEKASSELGLGKKTVKAYAQATAAIICDIIDGRHPSELLYPKRKGN